MFYKEVKHKHLVEDFTQVSFLYNRNSKEQESLRDIHHFLSILKTSNFHNISGKEDFSKMQLNSLWKAHWCSSVDQIMPLY